MKTVARLGVATQAAEGEATRLVRHARTEDGEDAAPVRVRFGSILEAARGQVGSGQMRLTFWLVGVSLAVLLLATVNVANLLTARSIQQRTESAVRMALGATRTRVVAEAAAEAATLGVVGTVLALAVARWGGEVIRSTLLPEIYFPASGFTGKLLVFTGLTAMAAGIVASIVPAWHGTRGMSSRWLKHASSGHSPARSKLSVVLTNIQAAVCVVLLTGAGLFLRSVSEIRSVDLGLEVRQLLQATLVFADPDLDSPGTIALHEEAKRRVASLPEVASAATTTAPLGLVSSVPLSVPGLDSIPDLPGGGPYVRYVSPEYFETTGVGIVRGRAIEAGDPPTVAVVSETMAAALWAGEDPLGACMRLYGGQVCTTVVGVSEDAAHTGFQDDPFMAFYLPQDGESPYQAIYVRAEGDAAEMVGAVTATLRSFSPQVRTARVETLEDLLDPQVRSWRIGAVLFSLFGVLAVSLSGIGLFAVLAYDVSGRTREIGIRSALGAGRMHLLRDMLKKGMQMTGIGLILGLVAVYVGAPYARDLLFQVSPRDPIVLATVAALVLTVTVAGSLLPGVRAVRVSPIEPLKAD